MATSDPTIVTPESPAIKPWRALISRPAQTIYLVALLMVLPLFIPALANRLATKDQTYREMIPNPRDLISFNGSAKGPGAGDVTGGQDPGQGGTPDVPVQNQTDKDIEDPSGSLAPFYAALAKTEAKQPGAITRITHYGDSPITNDVITGHVRHAFQIAYGDSGHGFILIDPPWDSYVHQGISFTSNKWDNANLMAPKNANGLFGLGALHSAPMVRANSLNTAPPPRATPARISPTSMSIFRGKRRAAISASA